MPTIAYLILGVSVKLFVTLCVSMQGMTIKMAFTKCIAIVLQYYGKDLDG
ncbi:hypothetical protein H6F44_10225 [Pseudanabaena sp. FACHB-1277]|uniref:Uncharacterized protein n=1 Tax=Pseudanabaena cinerea FACHB-1277 TaxID=2949581 RepID=A0A926UV05_9CYAN|nr:hypothetical protein [Pseudanabaena cinerea]MBD2150492.1 hypothetical protein [Pseudanabaena cinerea FACHB-1277]